MAKLKLFKKCVKDQGVNFFKMVNTRAMLLHKIISCDKTFPLDIKIWVQEQAMFWLTREWIYCLRLSACSGTTLSFAHKTDFYSESLPTGLEIYYTKLAKCELEYLNCELKIQPIAKNCELTFLILLFFCKISLCSSYIYQLW
jgi:hypothetical protein